MKLKNVSVHLYLYNITRKNVITAITEIIINEFAKLCQSIVPALNTEV